MHRHIFSIGKSGILYTSLLSVPEPSLALRMSQTTKIVIGLVVLALVAGGAYWYWQEAHAPSSEEKAEVTTLPSGADKSDAALEQDFSSIDTQIQAVGKDNANTDASVKAAASQ